jgi:flagellar hook-length control protein FliK
LPAAHAQTGPAGPAGPAAAGAAPGDPAGSVALAGAKGVNPSASPSLSVQQALARAGLSAAGSTPATAAAAPLTVAQVAAASPDRGDAAAAPKAVPNGLAVATYVTALAQPAPTAAGGGAAPSVAEQIGHAIQARLEVAPDEGRIDFHLRLDPPELGQVRVQLTLTNQTLTARLVAHDDSTRQLIQGQMEALRQRLQETGLGLGQLDVSGGDGGRGGRQQQPLLPWPDPAGAGPLPRPVAAGQPARPVAAGIDVMA